LFKNYGPVDNVFDEGTTELVHITGEVLLVEIWATWSGPSEETMAKNQQMAEKNKEAWKNKVRLLMLAADRKKEPIQKRVEEKSMSNLTHLTLNGWKKDHPLFLDYNVDSMPFVWIIDQNGRVNYVSHSINVNIEERINQLLNDPPAPKEVNQPQRPASI
jgi:thiol-disulfide isomerase/thioredoxin